MTAPNAAPIPAPKLMGILNVNADSFSDPGQRRSSAEEVARGVALRDAGAQFVDVGAESASPATPVIDAGAEIDALLPVLDGLHRQGVRTSVDTYKPQVAAAAIAAGTAVINDYSGLVHPELAGLCADGGVDLVLTHNPPGVKAKVLDPAAYAEVADDVTRWFADRLKVLEAAGLPAERVILDPGIDLAKTPSQSIELLRGLDRVAWLGRPLLLAISRKDFLGALSPARPRERDAGTLAALGHLIGLPRTIARVHDVRAARQYLDVAVALADTRPVDPELALPSELRRQVA